MDLEKGILFQTRKVFEVEGTKTGRTQADFTYGNAMLMNSEAGGPDQFIHVEFTTAVSPRFLPVHNLRNSTGMPSKAYSPRSPLPSWHVTSG